MAFDQNFSGGRRNRSDRNQQGNDSQAKLLKQLKEDIETIRTRQREMYEIMLSYKQDMFDLKKTVTEALKGLPKSPYIAGKLIPSPRTDEGFELFEDMVKTYLHRHAQTSDVEPTADEPETTETDESDETAEEEKPRRRRRSRRRRRRKGDAEVAVEKTVSAELSVNELMEDVGEETADAEEVIPTALADEQTIMDDTVSLAREEVMSDLEEEDADDSAAIDRDDEDEDDDDEDDDSEVMDREEDDEDEDDEDDEDEEEDDEDEDDSDVIDRSEDEDDEDQDDSRHNSRTAETVKSDSESKSTAGSDGERREGRGQRRPRRRRRRSRGRRGSGSDDS